MRNQYIYKMKWPLLIAALLFPSALHAQTLIGSWTNSGYPSVNVAVDSNGTFYATGPSASSVSLSSAESTILGSGGPCFVWVPSAASFRGGSAYSGAPATSDMGSCSFAFGYNCYARGFASVAIGSWANAAGYSSTALGASGAYGNYSVALGSATTGGAYTTATGESYANGQYSVAMGDSTAPCDDSVAIGYNNNAIGQFAPVAIGNNLTVSSYSCTALGCYNQDSGNQYSWILSDPLLEVGNGSATQPSNALVVYKNGNATFQGVVTVAPSADIPMYTGNSN